MLSCSVVISINIAFRTVVIFPDVVSGADNMSLGPTSTSGGRGIARVVASTALGLSLYITVGTGTLGPVATHWRDASRVQGDRSHPRDPQSVPAPQGKVHRLHLAGVARGRVPGDGQVQPLLSHLVDPRQAAGVCADHGVGERLNDEAREECRSWRCAIGQLHECGVSVCPVVTKANNTSFLKAIS